MQRQSKSKTGDVVRTVGPAHYNPKWPNEYHPGQQGISFGTAVRKDEDTTIKHNPAPNAYILLGDFDFKDSTQPVDHPLHDRGKNPKFAFGIKPQLKTINHDFPGPGEYETDQKPMNQANIGYNFGTDVRRDLSVPFSHMYPGPGFYDPNDPSLSHAYA